MIVLLFLNYVGFLSSGVNQKPINLFNLTRYNPYSLKETQSLGLFLWENRINKGYSGTTKSSRNTLKQWGIYTGEFTSALIPSVLYTLYIGYDMFQEEDFFGKIYFKSYMLFNSTVPAGMVIITGSLFKQKGSWWKSLLGSAVGSFAGLGLAYWGYYYGPRDADFLYLIVYISPSLFATIGYNL
ncbi:MAG TPA: hypothetical protein ENL19_00760 [candidate division WOR-3 bacterium]|uniref:Uncharacterized protein n=1 Tax=candidate division WOR-3 bacterium TaxID=2052148 RepID=A0A7C5HFW0_UNCW3|nr:hypothetical protein [candidate division WOR-3 bacterium]